MKYNKENLNLRPLEIILAYHYCNCIKTFSIVINVVNVYSITFDINKKLWLSSCKHAILLDMPYIQEMPLNSILGAYLSSYF